jgi:predicted transcriptional regulator
VAVARRAKSASRGGWTFVSNHFVVLLCIAQDESIRIADVADRIGLTDRAVQGIVADLVDAGYLTRTRVGRRNHYEVNRDMPLRHLQTQHRRLGELLQVMGASPRRRRSKASR